MSPIEKNAVERRQLNAGKATKMMQERKMKEEELELQNVDEEGAEKAEASGKSKAQHLVKSRDWELKSAKSEERRRATEKAREENRKKKKVEEVIFGESQVGVDEGEAWREALLYHRRVKRGEDNERRANRESSLRRHVTRGKGNPRDRSSPVLDLPRSFSSEIMRKHMAEVEEEAKEERRDFFAVFDSLQILSTWAVLTKRAPSSTKIYYRQKELMDDEVVTEMRTERKDREKVVMERIYEGRENRKTADEEEAAAVAAAAAAAIAAAAAAAAEDVVYEWLDDDDEDVAEAEAGAMVTTVMKNVVEALKNTAGSALDFEDTRSGRSAPLGGGEFPTGDNLCQQEQTSTKGYHQTSTTLNKEEAAPEQIAHSGKGTAQMQQSR